MHRTTSPDGAARGADRRWPRLAWGRVVAVLLKEFIQLRRDRLTFAMLIGVPIMQLVLFGYAINGDPRHLPTAVVAHDSSPFVRSIVRAVENTGYFRVVDVPGESQAETALAEGRVQFVLVFPSDFTHRLLRGDQHRTRRRGLRRTVSPRPRKAYACPR